MKRIKNGSYIDKKGGLAHGNDTTYAYSDKLKRLVHIDSVDRGLACGCICPCCKKPMIANQGKIRQNYFSHERKSGNQYNAQICQEVTMHMLAEQILKEKKMVMLPDYYKISKAHQIVFKSVEVEERRDRPDIQPDIVGITADGKRYLIEIKFSHAVDYEKKKKIYSDDLTCVEIDISHQNMDGLEDFLLNKTDSRVWINNKYGFDSIVDSFKRRGYDVRVILMGECEYKYAPDNCTSCVESKIMHCGKHFIICSSIPECKNINIDDDKWQRMLDELYEKPTREEKVKPAYYAPSRRSYPSPTISGTGVQSNYPCLPDNFFTTIDDYYNKIRCNQVFFENDDSRFSILNHYKTDNGEKFGVVVTSKNKGMCFWYVIVSKPGVSFIHEWSHVCYYSEKNAVLSLKEALGLK